MNAPLDLTTLTPEDVEMLRAFQAEERFIDFMRLCWPAVEPSRPIVEGWLIHAIAEHLEAVAHGHITRLIINVPPGCSKSLSSQVFWPAWLWGPMNRPEMRFMCASYSAALTERDNGRTCQLISNPLFRRHWGDRFSANESRVKVQNDKTGWKLATSVGGVGTGERADVVICLPFDGMILTDSGWLKIGEVVRDRLPFRVAGWSGSRIEWQEIEEYEINPAGRLVESDCGCATLQCTSDHPVWVDGKGYVPAGDVRPGHRVLVTEREALRRVWDDISGQAIAPSGSEVLLAELPVGSRKGDGAPGEQSPLSCVWGNGISTSCSSGTDARRPVLQSQVPRHPQQRGGEPSLSDRENSTGVCPLWGRALAFPTRSATGEILFPDLFEQVGLGSAWKTYYQHQLHRVREILQASSSRRPDVFGGMQEPSAFPEDEGTREWPIRAWPCRQGLPGWMDSHIQAKDQAARWPRLQDLRDDAAGSRKGGTACSSYRLREGEFVAGKSRDPVPLLPREDARFSGEARGVSISTVRSVRWLDDVPDLTFNIRTTPHHNYFADGILVHNCDDALSVKEADSAVVRDTMRRWLRETLPTRLNDPERSAIVVIEQRTHEEDATGTLLSDGGDYEHLMIPMEWDGRRYTTGIGWTDPRTIEDIEPGNETREPWRVKGELCFPERFPVWVVERDKKAMGGYAVSGQFQQMPVPRGGGIIQREWWQQWGPDDPRGAKFPPFELIIGFYDGAYTTKEHNDPSAMTVMGVFSDRYPNPGADNYRPTGAPKVMVVRCWAERLTINDAVKRVDETCRRYKVNMLLVENKATGLSMVQELHRIFASKPYSIVEVAPGGVRGGKTGDKVARTMSVVPLFEDKMVYAPRTDWATEMIDELALFPRGSHDDRVDCVVGGLRWLRDNGMLERETEWVEAEREDAMDRDRESRMAPLYRT